MVSAIPFAPATPSASLDSSATANTALNNVDSSSALKTQSAKKESAGQSHPNAKPTKSAKKDSTVQKKESAKTTASSITLALNPKIVSPANAPQLLWSRFAHN
jgi:hypothetical protein